MKTLFTIFAAMSTAIVLLFRPGGVRGLVAENLLLKHQLVIQNRGRKRSPPLHPMDRLLFGLGSLLLRPSRLAKVVVVVRPSTILRFHQALVRQKYRSLFSSKRRSKPGPKGPAAEIIEVILEIKRRNPRFGCPRIALIVTKTFGIEVNKDVVRRVLAKHYRPTVDGSGPSWMTFLGHVKDGLWSIDLFRCESATLKSYWVMVVLDQFTRRIIGFGVQRIAVDGPALCRMFNTATARSGIPKRVSTDNDPLFEFHRWKANLRILNIDEVKTVPFVPVSHPFVERLIGTIRREYLDHMMFWGQRDLERKLAVFQSYYNTERVHSSLDGKTPEEHAGGQAPGCADINQFAWRSTCNGLAELPRAA